MMASRAAGQKAHLTEDRKKPSLVED